MGIDEKRRKMLRPLPVADLLTTALHGKPAEKRLREGKIWLVWEGTVGPTIAAQARPTGFRDGILTVMVASSPWMQQLTFLKRDIIVRLNSRLGSDLIKDIYLRAGRPEMPQITVKSPPPAPRPLSPAERERIAIRTADVEDQDLRSALSNLFARHLASRKSEGSD